MNFLNRRSQYYKEWKCLKYYLGHLYFVNTQCYCNGSVWFGFITTCVGRVTASQNNIKWFRAPPLYHYLISPENKLFNMWWDAFPAALSRCLNSSTQLQYILASYIKLHTVSGFHLKSMSTEFITLSGCHRCFTVASLSLSLSASLFHSDSLLMCKHFQSRKTNWKQSRNVHFNGH